MAEHNTRSRRLLIGWSWFVVVALLACGDEARRETDATLAPSQASDGAAPHNQGGDSAAMDGLDAESPGLDAGAASGPDASGPQPGDEGQPESAQASDAAGDATASPGREEMVRGDAGRDAPRDPLPSVACSGSVLPPIPDDPAARGPFPVGVRTLQLALAGVAVPMTVELWYPAKQGSEAGRLAERYDLAALLPSGQASKLRPEDSLHQRCDCYRDLPVDSEHGPYPAVIYVHGTGASRTASLSLMTHWASRGFVVIAADHLGSFVQDFLADSSLGECQGTGVAANLERDLDAELAALASEAGPLAFLGAALDRSRIALSGHGPGAQAVALASSKPNVLVELPLAPTAAVSASASLKSTLMLSGLGDTVARWATVHLAYSASPAPKRLVGIREAEHFDLTDLCSMRSPRGETPTQVAGRRGVCGMWLLDAVARCARGADAQKMQRIARHATTAALEETLHCRDRKRAFAELQALYPEVGALEMSAP